MKVLNDMDRFQLVMGVVDRVPQTGARGIALEQRIKDQRVEHKRYIKKLRTGHATDPQLALGHKTGRGRLSDMNFELPRVYLIRHGETAWTLTGQHTARTDRPLTEEGERQARELGQTHTVLRIYCIFSSPLQRAHRTDKLALPHFRVEADDDQMEWYCGAYEGRRTTENEIDRLGWCLFLVGCPNGETLDAVGARADRVISRIHSPGGNVLLSDHREVLRILTVCWIGLSPIEGCHLLLAAASLSILGYDHDLTEPVIHAWNGHVSAAASAQ